MKQDTTGIVIAHYDPAGKVARYLRQLVVYLTEQVTPHVVFVSTGISAAAAVDLAKHCHVIQRDGGPSGWVLGSYLVGSPAKNAVTPFEFSFNPLDPLDLFKRHR